MKLVLSFFIILIIILILIFGIIFSKLKIKTKKLRFKLFKKDLISSDYDFILLFYFWGILKLFEIEVSNGNLKLLFFDIPFEKILSSKYYLKKVKPKVKQMNKKEILENLKKINFKIEKIDLKLEIGTDSVFLTSILVGIMSAIISSSMQNYIDKFKKEKYRWNIKPNFNENFLINLDANLSLSYLPILNKIIKTE